MQNLILLLSGRVLDIHSFVAREHSTMFLQSLLTASWAISTHALSQTTNILAGHGLVFGRMDPLRAPGKLSGHTHVVFGGNRFSIDMDDTAATGSTCANTLLKADSSNYWTPALYFQSPANGTFYSVPVEMMVIYYRFEETSDKIVAFQPGFRMVSGDATLRSPPAGGPLPVTDHAQGEINPVEITCPTTDASASSKWPAKSDGLHGVGIPQPNRGDSGAGFPNQYCDSSNGNMRLNVRFPSCYNPQVRELLPSGDNLADCPLLWKS